MAPPFIATCLVAVALNGSAEAALVPSCSPVFNGPGTLAPGTVVAPYLRVVTSSYSIGTCDSTIVATLRSADGTLWGVDMGHAKNGLWRSTNGMQTWQLAWEPSSYRTVEHVLQLASGAMLAVVVDPAGIRHIVRAPDSSGTSFSATYSLDFPANGRIHTRQSWVETNGAIYVATYGDPAPPLVLWKSTDDGRTFSAVYSRTDIRHFHAVQADPYVAGRIWLTAGDGSSQSRIGYSDDGGATFAWIDGLTYPASRAVTLMFTPDAVYWGADIPELPAPVSRWDRTTNAVSTVLSGLNGPFYNEIEWSGIHFQFTAIEGTADGYRGDNYIHVLTSGDGNTWRLTRTPFARTAGATDQTALMSHFTVPDAQGRFWGGFFNLDGTQYKNANVLFQIDPAATYAGPQAAFTATPGTDNAASFDGTASSTPNGPLTWTWRFGDGTTGSGATVTHTYPAAGTYTVLLQVTDSRGDANETTSTVTVGAVASQAPTVSTGSASGVSSSAATVSGSVNPNGVATSVWFEFGTSSAYGSQTAVQSAGAGSSSLSVSAPLSGLSPGTVYHYRLVGSSSAGTSVGADRTFTTQSPVVITPPVVTTDAPRIQKAKVQFRGVVNPKGAATTYFFRYGPTTAYGTQTPAGTLPAGTSPVTVTTNSDQLSPGTYHVQLVATNSAGTTYGGDVVFTVS